MNNFSINPEIETVNPQKSFFSRKLQHNIVGPWPVFFKQETGLYVMLERSNKLLISGAAMQGEHCGEITHLLEQINQGQADAVARLMDRVYHDLRDAARAIYVGQIQDTLGPTSVVHEFFIRFSRHAIEKKCRFANRAEFFGFAIRLMRNVIADHGRFHMARKRGGPERDLSLEGLGELMSHSPEQSYLLHVVLSQFEAQFPPEYEVVCLHFFFGMTLKEIADIKCSSHSTVKRQWQFAKAWLYRYAGQTLEKMDA